MTVTAPKPASSARQGSFNDIGAFLTAIRALSTNDGPIDEEDACAVYSLACMALVAWKKLDAAADQPRK